MSGYRTVTDPPRIGGLGSDGENETESGPVSRVTLGHFKQARSRASSCVKPSSCSRPSKRSVPDPPAQDHRRGAPLFAKRVGSLPRHWRCAAGHGAEKHVPVAFQAKMRRLAPRILTRASYAISNSLSVSLPARTSSARPVSTPSALTIFRSRFASWSAVI